MSERGLLIACGEQAIRSALDNFEREMFGDEDVERILLPGGCWWLAEAAVASAGRLKRAVMNRSAAIDGVRALLAATRGPVALVGHQDCSWYRSRYLGLSPGEVVKRIGTDIYSARDEMQRLGSSALLTKGVILVRGDDGWSSRSLF